MGIETVAMLAGTAMSAAGSIQKGKAAQQAANYNITADAQRAASDRDAAAAEADDFTRKGSGVLSSAVAAQGASGVTGEGSPLAVDEGTIRAIATGAARKLQQGEINARNFENDAVLQKMKGDNAVTSSYLDAGSSLLTGFGKYAGGKI